MFTAVPRKVSEKSNSLIVTIPKYICDNKKIKPGNILLLDIRDKND